MTQEVSVVGGETKPTQGSAGWHPAVRGWRGEGPRGRKQDGLRGRRRAEDTVPWPGFSREGRASVLRAAVSQGGGLPRPCAEWLQGRGWDGSHLHETKVECW